MNARRFPPLLLIALSLLLTFCVCALVTADGTDQRQEDGFGFQPLPQAAAWPRRRVTIYPNISYRDLLARMGRVPAPPTIPFEPEPQPEPEPEPEPEPTPYYPYEPDQTAPGGLPDWYLDLINPSQKENKQQKGQQTRTSRGVEIDSWC